MDIGTAVIVIAALIAYVLLVGMALTGILQAQQLDPLQRVIWVAVIVLAPILGSIAWFWLGRPRPLRVGKRL